MSASGGYYLKQNVVIEPLVMRWYAWPHLISPASNAMNIAFKHLTIMESFIKSPELHAQAILTPNLRGGPFLNYPATEVENIKYLLEETKKKQKLQIQFAEGLKEAMRLVVKFADGNSLTPLYPMLPDVVKGYVELYYSINGGADLRVIEPLLYRSPIYNPDFQSSIIHQVSELDRHFALSTPRIYCDNSIELCKPFSDDIYDFLSNLRFEPQSHKCISNHLLSSSITMDVFEKFLTEEKPSISEYEKSSIARWRYFGHACVLVEAADGSNVLVDPVFAYQNGNYPSRYSLVDLPERIDYVLLTHNHQDHVLIESLLALRPRISKIIIPSGSGSIADPSLKLALNACGFKNVMELSSLESISSGEIKFTALPFLGEHADLNIQTKAGWLVEASNLKILFAADSNNIEPNLYDLLRPLIGKVDILFIGMECAGAPLSWLYGALLPRPLDHKKDNSRRLDGSDFSRAMNVISSLDCDKVYIYAMGREPWLSFITSIDPDDETIPMQNARKLLDACREKGIYAELLYGMADG